MSQCNCRYQGGFYIASRHLVILNTNCILELIFRMNIPQKLIEHFNRNCRQRVTRDIVTKCTTSLIFLPDSHTNEVSILLAISHSNRISPTPTKSKNPNNSKHSLTHKKYPRNCTNSPQSADNPVPPKLHRGKNLTPKKFPARRAEKSNGENQ